VERASKISEIPSANGWGARSGSLGLYLGFAVANRDWDSLMHTLLFVVAVVAFIVASGLVVGFV